MQGESTGEKSKDKKDEGWAAEEETTTCRFEIEIHFRFGQGSGPDPNRHRGSAHSVA